MTDNVKLLRLCFGIGLATLVFIIVPSTVLYLSFSDQIELPMAETVLKYITNISSSPAGDFVWDRGAMP